MFKEILKIIPQLDNKDLNKMEQTLSKRFGRIAKKFGGGLLSAIKGAGVVGLALSVIDKIINPLQEVQSSIDRLLKRGDDLVTFSNQFGTTPGKLAKLGAFAQSAGLDQDSLYTALNKFQARLSMVTADPNADSSIRGFAGRTDTADAFFEYVQRLGQLMKSDPNAANLSQQEVFGEKQILKMSDFLQSDFNELNKYFANIKSEDLTKAARKLGGYSDLADALGASRDLNDLLKKSKVINQNMILAQDQREKAVLERENERIQSYKSISNISEASTKILTLIEKGALMLTDLVTKVTNLEAIVKKLAPSRLLRGIFGGGD